MTGVRTLDSRRKLTTAEVQELCTTMDLGRSAAGELEHAAVADVARLRRSIEAARNARERFIEANMGLVHYFAARHPSVRAGRLDYDDAVQAATIGLCRAVDGFAVSRGYRFSTYAEWWIRKELHAASRAAQANPVRRSERGHRELARLLEAEEALRLELHRAPTEAELAGELGSNLGQVRSLRAHAMARYDDATFAEIEAAAGSVDTVDRSLTALVVDWALECLTAEERRVVKLRFGFDEAADKRSFAEVARLVGSTEWAVRVLVEGALAKMRPEVGDAV